MNPESLHTSSPEAQTGIEKRREVAEEIKKLWDSKFEAAQELIEQQGGIELRGRTYPMEQGKEGRDVWFEATRLFSEALQQKRLAAEGQNDLIAAKQFTLAEEFSKSHHNSVTTYLDAHNAYPELMELIKEIYPNYPQKLQEAQEAYHV
jgi:hypothetical protein